MAAADAFTQTPAASLARAPTSSTRRFWSGVAVLWLATTLVMLVTRAHAITHYDFPDADDQLRLVEVRDWLAGQSFTDVSQHRMNAPYGVAMHWSRLVDMPLALVILLLRPLIGGGAAEMAAAAAVPLATLGVIMAATGAIGRRLGGPAIGLLATAFCVLCLPMMQQISPLRVDHHGWEIAFQLLALLAALGAEPRRSGGLAGAALAVALQISLEPLPFTAAVGGVFALDWALHPSPERRTRVCAFLVTLAGGETALTAILHAPSAWSVGFCDAVSPPHLLLLAVSAAGIAALTHADPAARGVRLSGLALVAACAAAAYRAYPPHCGVDAFANLEPIVRTFWFDRTLEGMPLWRLPPVLAASTVGFALIGTACAAFAARHAAPEGRALWTTYALLLAAATLAAAAVQRAGGFASVAAAPAAARMVVRLVPRCLASGSPPTRVVGTVAACFAFCPIAAVTAVALVARADPDAARAAPVATRPCNATEHVAGLSALPPSRLLAPLDLGPAILLDTPHSPLASGHHRNHVAMAQVLTAFLGGDDVAHRIVTRRGIAYVTLCPTTAEIGIYAKQAPDGFAAHLVARRAPAWLVPVALPHVPILVWRVRG